MLKNYRSFVDSIKHASKISSEVSLLRTFRTADSLDISREFRDKTMNHEISYNEVFITGLNNHDYNLILIDRSYFQFTMCKVKSNIVYRYGYYPNPFISYEDDDTENIEKKELSDFHQKIHLSPPIRYDIDFEAYRELIHSACHLHIGLHDNRIPIDKYISPFLFTLFIFKTFYGDEWNKHDSTIGISDGRETYLSDKYKRELSVCKYMKIDAFFSQKDRQQLFIT